ncbi:MAG: hypothetical protein M1840_004427 [Geoglossum simile]|nr:MAG: hypothetical protein M1840_004427 [Geoglossum simile]
MFSPVNHGSGNSADTQPKSLAPGRSADRAGSLKGPPKWEAGAFKARASNRKRSLNLRTRPGLRVDAPAANNAGSSHGCQGEQLLSTALMKKMKRANSSGVYDTSYDIRNPATKAAQARTKTQPLTDMSQRRKSEPTNNPTDESRPHSMGPGSSDFVGRRVMASPSTRYELSPETHRKLDSFKYVALSALGQTTLGSSSSREHRDILSNQSAASARTGSSLTQFEYIDTRPDALSSSVRDCKCNGAHVQAGTTTAKSPSEDEFYWSHDIDDGLLDQLGCTPEDCFEWDQNMDDALLDQLGQIEANASHTKNCAETDMNGDVDDEDIFALFANHYDLGSLDTVQENAKTPGESSPMVGREAQSLATPMYLSLAEITDDDEDLPFDMGDIVPFPGATGGISPPSLQYLFDNPSQMLGAYGSNLRGSSPPIDETPTSGNIAIAGDAQYEALISAANMPSSRDFCEIIDQTGLVADRMLAVTDDKIYTMAEYCVGGQDTEPTHVAAQPLTTNTNDDSVKKQKLRMRTPKPPAAIGPLATVKSKLAPHLLEYDATGNPKPFVRPLFPKQVQDRSPIVGLSSKAFLRTCFRVGEALRAGSYAGHWGQDAIIELYARVVFSSRDEWKQHFQFADLFHDRPPLLTGTYEIFHGVDLWERDSGRFLTEDGKDKMCRCIGRMKRVGGNWKLVVLNIWEATWDDVSWVKGIVCA